jgi:hypothetical protein
MTNAMSLHGELMNEQENEIVVSKIKIIYDTGFFPNFADGSAEPKEFEVFQQDIKMIIGKGAISGAFLYKTK